MSGNTIPYMSVLQCVSGNYQEINKFSTFQHFFFRMLQKVDETWHTAHFMPEFHFDTLSGPFPVHGFGDMGRS